MDDKITSQVQPFLDLIAEKQSVYFKENGKYWQGFKTMNTIPEVSVFFVPKMIENIKDKPSHLLGKSWEEMGLSKLELPFVAEIHEYQAPNNQFGYRIILTIIKDGIKYNYSKGYGIESDTLTHDWKEVKEKIYGTN